MSYDVNNPFARILRGEAPASMVYEDEHAVAFMDLMPQVEGHTLVVPRSPSRDLFDIDPEVLAGTMRATQTVARAVRKAFDAPGIMVAQLSGAAAGQTVFHLHFHILPRFNGIEFRLHAAAVEDRARLDALAARIRAALPPGPVGSDQT
jgi:histidine triad (HIT) family protein